MPTVNHNSDAKRERNVLKFKKSDESKRNTKWVSFSKSKVSFGFQHLGPAYVPSMASERKGLAVCLEKVGGWSIPSQVLKEFGKGDYEITAQLSFSMFHLNSSTFFGSTWMGPSVSLGNSHSKIPKVIDFDYVDIVYMISRITDPSCVGVIEIVVSKFDSKRNLVASQFGCGWTMLNLFLKPFSPDISDGHENIPLKSCALFAGSPRDLIMNNDINSLAGKLKEIPDCSLFYKLCSHKRLLKAQHLISENECVGRFDVVAGLISRSAIPPGTGSAERFLACIGDEEKIDNRFGNYCLPAKPILAVSSLLKIANFQFLLTDRHSAEIRLLEEHNRHSKVKLIIQARYLKIGLHNGHSLVGGSWKTFALVEDDNDSDILLTKESVLVLGGYVPNEYMALVLMVQYDVGSPHNRDSHADSAAIVQAMSRGDERRSASATITLGSTLFIPSDGKTISLRNNSRGADGGGVNIELALLRDEVSSLLSPSPDAADTNQLSLEADQKTNNRLSITADFKRDAKTSEGSTKGMAIKTKLSFSVPPEVGFDLKVVHPSAGELAHGDDVDGLLCMADGDRRGADETVRSRTPEWTEQVSMSDVGDEGSALHSKDSKFTKNPVAPRGGSDDSDDRSVTESIVTGTSEHSGFRLDPTYYFSGRQTSSPGRVRVQPESVVTKGRMSNAQVADDRQSLMGQSMQAMFRPFDKQSVHSMGELLIQNAQRDRQLSSKSISPLQINAAHSRDVSRGAKSRLNRYGFQSAIEDTREQSRGQSVVVDVHLEARDPLSLHEINIQFAAFRPVSSAARSLSVPVNSQSFEAMRLVAALSGESHVFVREDSHSRNETPLTLRYLVDTSCGSPHEAMEFAEYLAHNALYVDLWDADSLLLLGTFAIPLRKLLRQGKGTVKHVIECDVVHADMDADCDGGISSCVVADGGPVSGAVVGAVQVIVSNYGQTGKGVCQTVSSRDVRSAEDEDFNWRTLGGEEEEQTDTVTGRKAAGRPRHCTRARPLSESSPQLSLALKGVRDSAGGDHVSSSASMRSLTTVRGGGSRCTLTYDEVSVLFKRFQGIGKGMVQYAGDLMLLLDLPSWALALRRLVAAYRRFGGRVAVERELKRHSNADRALGQKDLEEFLVVLFDKSGLRGREDDRTLLASRLVADLGVHGAVTQQRLVRFCEEEIDREDWTLCSRRLRLAADSAYVSGEDVQQRLCEHDATGSDTVSSAKFKEFLVYLSKFGRVQEEDRALCVRHFSRLSCTEQSPETSHISLKDVMAFLGRDYVGNLQVRIQKCVLNSKISGAKDVLTLFARHKQASSSEGRDVFVHSFSYREVEAALGELGVFKEITHDQLQMVLKMLDTKSSGLLSGKQLMAYLGIDYSSSDIPGGELAILSSALSPRGGSALNIEDMLRILLEKVRSNGLAVDEAFRHFDTDGDGSISMSELEQALDDLCIFSGISDWKKQVPSLLAKFDASGDGQVSLREFFKFLGLSADYTPNIVQKMTNIFAIATQKGLSIKDIFTELDADGSGALSADELQAGLKKIGTFGEISSDDAAAVVKRFDSDGDHKVSTEEFVKFFAERIRRTVRDRGRKLTDRKPVVKQFREVMMLVQAKGLSARELFGHIDKDKGGSISADEFLQVLTRLPQFKDLSQSGLHEIFDLIDIDGSGGISLFEFEQFLSDSSVQSKPTRTPSASISERVREVFKVASTEGLSFAKTFELVDRDGDGQLSVAELDRALKRLPHFVNLETREVESLFQLIDSDNCGRITIAEFKHFAEGGSPVLGRQKPPRSDQQGQCESDALNDGEFSAQFVRVMNGLLKHDSGVFARLDKDEDGLVEVSVLLRVLSKNRAFDTLSETRSESLLHQFIVQRKFISLDAFMSFVGERPSTAKITTQKHSRVEFKEDADDGDGEGTRMRDYDFSANPETKALEKKVRGFGKVLAKKGVDVEAMFRDFDIKQSGVVRRSELVEVLSRLGMHILEQGRVFDHALFPSDDLRRSQVRQINRLKGSGGDYLQNAPRLARRALLAHGSSASFGVEFTDHLESMSLVNSYRSSQKQMLLQRVLAHNLEKTVRIYPRFGTALFFEHPITNPFGHEERFQIEVSDPELRIVTSFDEWLHLRSVCRPCVGEVGSDPVEVEMFDTDDAGRIQVVLLPYETLHIPFTFLTLSPVNSHKASPDQPRAVLIHKSSTNELREDPSAARDLPNRTTEVRVVSGTHGQIVSILRVLIHSRPFILHRSLRFFEAEKAVMKKRILLVGHEDVSSHPGDFTMAARYIHCVECGGDGRGQEEHAGQSKVVVEWGPSGETFGGMGSLDILLRYRCAAFPSGGMFYLLIFSDPYQSRLHEVWQVIVDTRQRADVHGCVGALVSSDLVVRGDRYARRARAYVTNSEACEVSCLPDAVFQLIPGAYNRLSLNLVSKVAGYRRLQVNLVDVDSRELISAWVVVFSSTAPSVMRSYEVDVGRQAIHKKIVYSNPWDVPRRFSLTSSDEAVMRPRSLVMEVGPRGTAYLRLWFAGQVGGSRATDVHLFLNDHECGQNEECYLFRINAS